MAERLKRKFDSFGFNGEIHMTRFALVTMSILIVSVLAILKDNDYLASIVVKLIKLIFGVGS